MPVAGAGIQSFSRPVTCLIFVQFLGGAGGLPLEAV